MELRLDDIRVDTAKAVDGVWTEVYPGWELLIASASTPEYEAIAGKVRAPYDDLIAAGKMPDDMHDKMVREIYARAIVKGSRGLAASEYGPGGAFSPEWALKMLSDPGLHFVWTRVRVVARELDAYRAKAAETAAKN